MQNIYGEDWAILVREMETSYCRGHEVPRAWPEACGFTAETAQCYGWHPLAPRRRAFFARLGSRPID